MKLKTWLRQAVAGALCLLLCIAGMTGTALGDMQPLDNLDMECSLAVKYLHGDKNVSIYRVAGVSEYLYFTPEGEFKDILNGLSDETLRDLNNIGTDGTWRRLAKALDLEVLRRGDVDTLAVAKTKKENNGFFARFEGLTPGLYLVTSERYSVEEQLDNGETKTVWYDAAPYLVCLPGWSETDKAWNGDVVMDVSGKMSGSVDEKISIKVLKVWLDSSGRPTGSHPSSVTINLLCDGKPYESVTLDESGWSKVWTDLDNAHRWDVEETSISGWNSSVDSDDGRSFTVTNRKKPDGNGGGGNDPSPTPPPDEITIKDPEVPLSVPPLEDEPEDPEEIEIDDPDVPLGELPQTGQLWWPVPLLAVSGMFLLLFGWGRSRRERYDEE